MVELQVGMRKVRTARFLFLWLISVYKVPIWALSKCHVSTGATEKQWSDKLKTELVVIFSLIAGIFTPKIGGLWKHVNGNPEIVYMLHNAS